MCDSSVLLTEVRRRGGERNHCLSIILEEGRRVLPAFAHCQSRKWDGLQPGLVSPRGRNLIQGFPGLPPPFSPSYLPFCSFGSGDANRGVSVLKVQGD